MYSCIIHVRELIYGYDNKKYDFINKFYLNWNYRSYFSSSIAGKTKEASNTCTSSKKHTSQKNQPIFNSFYLNLNKRLFFRTCGIFMLRSGISKSKIITADKPVYYILLSLTGGSVYNKNESSWNNEKIIAQKIQEAKSAIQNGNLKRGKEILEDIIDKYGNTKKIEVGMSCVYEMLATICYQNGELEKAQVLLITAVDKLLQSGIKNTDNIITSFTLKISRIYEKMRKDDFAELGYKNCIAMQKHKYITGQNDDETGLLWINSLFWYGKFLESKKRYMEAKQCFDSCYILSAHVKSIQPSQVMVIMYNLGEMAAATGDIDSAQRHYINAVILGKGVNSNDLAIYYIKLGLMNLYRGLNEQAYFWCDYGRLEAKRKKDKQLEDDAIKCLQQLKTN